MAPELVIQCRKPAEGRRTAVGCRAVMESPEVLGQDGLCSWRQAWTRVGRWNGEEWPEGAELGSSPDTRWSERTFTGRLGTGETDMACP